jgi:hypothetical protein
LYSKSKSTKHRELVKSLAWSALTLKGHTMEYTKKGYSRDLKHKASCKY